MQEPSFSSHGRIRYVRAPIRCIGSASAIALASAVGRRVLVESGHLGIKSGRGLYPWDAASIAKEKERHEKALQAVLAAFEREGLQ